MSKLTSTTPAKRLARRIGIFSGSFDPVHAGHIGLALQAIGLAKLDQVYFVPEIQPRRKTNVVHIAHRVAMLKLATHPHPELAVLELPDKNFTTAKTSPRLKQLFPNDKLFFICGADMLEHMPSWPLVERFLTDYGLIVGVRGDFTIKKVNKLIKNLPVNKIDCQIIHSQSPNVSSHRMRQAIVHGLVYDGLLPSTAEYVQANNLYV